MIISLIGYRGVGKTTLGQLLSHALNLPFIDLDKVIETTLNKTIPEIFAEQGEAYFRCVESSLLENIIRQQVPAVLATGGGVVLKPKNRYLLKAKTFSIYLELPVHVIKQRINNASRPRLFTTLSLFQEIEYTLRQRKPLYKRVADVTVNLASEPVEQSIHKILQVIPRQKKTLLTSHLQANSTHLESYQILIKKGLLLDISKHLNKQTNYVILSDSNVMQLYGEILFNQLRTLGYEVYKLTFPAGEKNKSLATIQSLHESDVVSRLHRKSIVLVLGGGVTGDLGGFFAATFMRGIEFYHVPTSLLAMVDSSIGGKLGVNTALGKNMLGLFKAPKSVFIDPLTLVSLPLPHLQEGLSETVKHAILSGPAFFSFLEKNVQSIMQYNMNVLEELIQKSISIKLEFVKADDLEQGKRKFLNLGHTFAHSIEQAMNYKNISHGQAVSVGLVLAAKLSRNKGFINETLYQRVKNLLHAFELPTTLKQLETNLDADFILTQMSKDKKKQGNKLPFVLFRGFGKAMLIENVKKQELIEVIEDSL